MRNVPPFRCDGCGATSGYPGRCDDCEQPYLDARGRICVRPHSLRRRLSRTLKSTLWVSLGFALLLTCPNAFFIAVGGHGLGLLGCANAVAWLVFLGATARSFHLRFVASPNVRHRRAARAARKRAELRPISGQGDGYCRVRGRARVLRAVSGAAGAVFHRERTSHTYLERDPIISAPKQRGPVSVTETVVTDTAECGRFAVVDSSGVAIVDDDAFMVWSLSRPPSLDATGSLEVNEGDEVEVLGPARLEHVEEASALLGVAASSYRAAEPPRALVFDGRHDDPVWILVL